MYLNYPAEMEKKLFFLLDLVMVEARFPFGKWGNLMSVFYHLHLSEEGVENAQGWQIPTLQLYDSYDADDRRRAVTFVTEVHNKNGTTTEIRPYIQKYWDRTCGAESQRLIQ